MEFKRSILSSKERVNDTKSRQKLNSCLRVDKINIFFFDLAKISRSGT